MNRKTEKINLHDQYFQNETDTFSERDVRVLLKYFEHPLLSRDQYIMQSASWTALYHLSPMRSNIIESVGITDTCDVLEIGAECGAVTERLCDLAATVTCVEPSRRKSEINALRNQDCTNLNIYVGNFEQIETNELKQYDVVTMLGAFSHAAEYVQGESPYICMLQLAMRHVKDHGKLVIGIENRLGLKYLAGCKEPYSGLYFEGIEGYTQKEHIRTFSKQELLQIISAAGYEKVRIRYPYPDYQFTMDIFSDEYLPEKGQLKMSWFEMKQSRQFLFDEAKAFDSMLDAGLFPEVSNSFLIEIEK